VVLSAQQKKNLFFGIIAAIALSYFYGRYGLWPVNKKISAVREELERVENKIKTMELTATRLPILQKESDNLQIEVRRGDKKLPKEIDLDGILRIVTTQALRHNVSIRGFSPDVEQSQAYFTEVSFVMEVSGTFHSVARFLASLGQEERILSARNLQLVESWDPVTSHTVTGTFRLLAYVFHG
jgi:type IV pilus assembly protein PilO